MFYDAISFVQIYRAWNWKMSNLRNNGRPTPPQQPLRTIATSNTIRNLLLREKSKMSSPMSNLTMNLSELSTGRWVHGILLPGVGIVYWLYRYYVSVIVLLLSEDRGTDHFDRDSSWHLMKVSQPWTTFWLI
jgi:hypothetical protein